MKRGHGSLSAQARRIEEEIADLARRMHGRMFGAQAPFPDSLRVSVDVTIPARSPEGADASPLLLAGIGAALQRSGSRTDPVLPGRVFCYRCDRADCEHAAPPRTQSVFSGYSPTGQPQWCDLAQALLEARHERVDELFSGSAPLAVVQPGRDLKARLLHPFGKSSKTYDVLGQIVAGHFGGPGEPPSAITVQAVESRSAEGRTRLTLNRIGAEASAFLDAHPEHRFAVALQAARGRLAQIEEDLAAGGVTPARRSELMRKVPGILQDLRRGLERSGRQSERRTKHAVERRRENRPTPAAIRDAWSAADADLLADETRGTLIVLGPRGRAHAFTPEGRHVTSLILDREALSRRIARRRWRP
ncbi:MAG TPA: hypothetical protein VG777_02080, partial [Thermoanaerobaculia bacterium]|nr:hypothetical protein [Thermoanaerobaculia bacterium]